MGHQSGIISNKVFTANVGQTIDLHHPDLVKIETYTPPRGQFPGGRLKLSDSMCLLFKTGKVVINGLTTEPDELQFALSTGLYLRDVKLSHCSAYMKVGKVNLEQLRNKMKGSTYEPELHPGLFYKMDNVSVIIYTTGTVMLCGLRDDEHLKNVESELMKMICE